MKIRETSEVRCPSAKIARKQEAYLLIKETGGLISGEINLYFVNISFILVTDLHAIRHKPLMDELLAVSLQ